MAEDTLNNLQERLNAAKAETGVGKNTKTRVFTLMQDILDTLKGWVDDNAEADTLKALAEKTIDSVLKKVVYGVDGIVSKDETDNSIAKSGGSLKTLKDLDDATTPAQNIQILNDRRYLYTITDKDGRILAKITKKGILEANLGFNISDYATIVLGGKQVVRSSDGKISGTEINTQAVTLDKLATTIQALLNNLPANTNTELSAKAASGGSLKTVQKLDEDTTAAQKFQPSADRRYLYTISDKDGRILYKITKDGKIQGDFDGAYIPEISSLLSRVAAMEDNPIKGFSTATHRKFLWMITDSENRILAGITKYGKLVVNLETDYSSLISALTDRVTAIEAGVTIKKTIVCNGDSLTVASYPSKLQTLLGSTNYTVVNRGVGGENSLSIAARQGGIPMYISNVAIPADTTPVVLGNLASSGIKSLFDNTDVKPLLQGGSTHVNNCYVCGIECILKWTGASYNDANGTYTLERVTAGAARTTTAKEIVYTSTMRQYRDAHCHVIFIGQNGGWSSTPATLVAQVQKMIDFLKYKNYIVIATHGTSTTTEVDTAMRTAFGAAFINLREYTSKYGIYDAGLTPTQADLDAMAVGNCPPQLLADSIHFTDTGYQLLANQVYLKMIELGL